MVAGSIAGRIALAVDGGPRAAGYCERHQQDGTAAISGERIPPFFLEAAGYVFG
jgi:hypothetical protein